MIRYTYQAQLQPPAPFVNVRLQNLATGTVLPSLPAQLDTAADRSVLPEGLAKFLNLPQVGIMNFGGFGGVTFSLPVYAVLLGIHDLPPRAFKVAGHPNESWLLLGRDVLNGYRIVLDGPKLALEIVS
jgi:hypothetical protein